MMTSDIFIDFWSKNLKVPSILPTQLNLNSAQQSLKPGVTSIFFPSIFLIASPSTLSIALVNLLFSIYINNNNNVVYFA